MGLVNGVVVCRRICGDAGSLLSELRSLSLLVWRHDYDLVFSIFGKDRYIGEYGIARIWLYVFRWYVWVYRLVRSVVSLFQLSACCDIVDAALVAHCDVLVFHQDLRIRDPDCWVGPISSRWWPSCRSSFVLWSRYSLNFEGRLWLSTRIVALWVRLVRVHSLIRCNLYFNARLLTSLGCYLGSLSRWVFIVLACRSLASFQTFWLLSHCFICYWYTNITTTPISH